MNFGGRSDPAKIQQQLSKTHYRDSLTRDNISCCTDSTSFIILACLFERMRGQLYFQ